jgi:hypothetical protein
MLRTRFPSLAYACAWARGWLAFHLVALLGRAGLGGLMAPRMVFDFEHVRGGQVIGRWRAWNLVTTVGKTDIVDKYLKGSSYTAAWFLGLAGAGTKAAGDTLASHAGWSELTPYAGNRPAITWGTTSGGANTATAVSISITGTATVAGAFVCSVNTGTSGTLYNVSDFAASRGVANGDTLNVTPTITIA